MKKTRLREAGHDSQIAVSDFPRQGDNSPVTGLRRPINEMSRVLKTTPVHIASDLTGGAIAQWSHDAFHEVVEPMTDHVIMTYVGTVQRLERRNGSSIVAGTARDGTVSIIPAGSMSRWDIYHPMDIIQLYLPDATLKRVALEANIITPHDLVERTAHPDLVTSRLLVSAADTVQDNEALDNLFRQQLSDLLATRMLSAHTGQSALHHPALGGLSPAVLRRAIERLQSDSDEDVSLAALASDSGLSRFHFCRAFKESTGLTPHNWLRRYRLEQAMIMLRDSNNSVAQVATTLGYASQTAFAAAFRKLTGETPSDWRRRAH
ncbi:helix-turn-helix transcriptional regulator [Bradyrhizobium uaiense]|uniref:Helix-turn-helix transcriptional regulator n=1 Tax=Bradyrhizobium uaiense TaxID=2594946 RepID=A0A6P1BMH5_9BRAD|nr:AraC family transcriptional regulator [Bradyrhizobium uaiense]NEU99605.1 helix-turn-helix transcriptional regulator [Bradyrhizobium uaiense]